MRRFLAGAIGIFTVLSAGCTTLSTSGAAVRMTLNPEVVRGCRFVGNVHGLSAYGGAVGEGETERQMQNKTAKLGGDVLMIISSNPGIGNGLSTAVGEAYACAQARSGQAAPAARQTSPVASQPPPAPVPQAAPESRPPQPISAVAPKAEQAPGTTSPPKAGFRDLKWGDPATPAMTFLGGDKTTGGLWYERSADNLSVGGVPLKSIRYGFFDGHLRMVTIRAAPDQEGALFSALIRVWGTPGENDADGASWGGEADPTTAVFIKNSPQMRQAGADPPAVHIGDRKFGFKRVKVSVPEDL